MNTCHALRKSMHEIPTKRRKLVHYSPDGKLEGNKTNLIQYGETPNKLGAIKKEIDRLTSIGVLERKVAPLDEASQKPCTAVPSEGNTIYLRLPMGIKTSPAIYQYQTTELIEYD